MLQKVKLTDKEQLEKERKEKGFALYVNGANDPKTNKNMRRKNPSPSPRTNNARLAAGMIVVMASINAYMVHIFEFNWWFSLEIM